MANKEAFFIIVGVNEPCSDIFLATGANLAGLGIEHVNPQHLDDDLAVIVEVPIDIRFTEDDKEIAASCVFELLRHMKVRVHLRFQDWQGTELGEFRRVGVEIEAAGDERIEAGVERFASRRGQIGARDGSELRAD